MELYKKVFDDTNLPFKSNEDTIVRGKRVNAMYKNLADVYNRIEVNLPSLIIIDGGLGQGKTTLAVEFADLFNDFKGLDPVDVKSCQYALGGDDFARKLPECFANNYPVIIYDEAGDFNRKSTLSKFNRNLDTIFNQFRAYKIIVILVLPCVKYLEGDLFTKGVVRALVNCYGRVNQNIGKFRVYELDRTNWVRHNITKEITPSKAYDRVTANNYGFFYDLSPKRSQELSDVGLKYKGRSMENASNNIEGLLSAYQIADKMGMSVFYVKNKIKLLKLKPQKVWKRKNLFSVEVLQRIKTYKEKGI